MGAAAQQQAHPIRQMFASTIALVLNTSGSGLLASLAQGILGAIAGWFGHKPAPPQYPQAYGVAQPQNYAPPATPYTVPGAYAASSTAYPSNTAAYPAPPTYPSNVAAYPAPPAYPSNTAAYPAPAASSYPLPAAPSASPSSYSGTGYPAPATASAYPGNSPYPSPMPAQPGASYPTSSGYPGTAPAYDAQGYPSNAGVQVYDAHTGQLTSAVGTAYQQVGSRGLDATLYAGIAYEVHAVAAGGTTVAVNPASHLFHTGDRFVVHYRPSMPGRMDVYNINPSGQRTRIDSVTMAAGQLATLGPYEFSSQTGDESLRLVLSPCTSPALLVATRDIVRVAATAAPSASPAIRLGACDAPESRDPSVTTRDIAKVAVDDGTAFALDPVSQRELSSGQVMAREVNIVFHHR
jgi:hypothetical protein